MGGLRAEAVVEAPGAPVLDEAQLWDARCRTDPAVAYRRTCGDRDARERAPGRTLAETIADTLRGRRTPHPPALRTHVAQHEEYIRIHTESHRNVLHHFSDNPRVLVRGAAGTGKTNLAVHAAARLAALGERVLLACWNIMLAGTLRRAVHAELRAMQSPRAAQVTAAGDGAVVVGHVAGLARQGRPAIPADADTTFFQQTLPDALTTELTDGRFDAIVLDEAQDLSDAWMLALDRLLAPHGRWFAFADRHQDLFASRAALPDFLDLTHELRENFRNSRRIAEFASQFGIAELDCINPEGPPIRFVAAPWDRVVRRSERALRRLQATETLPNADVALLWLFHNPMRGRNDELAARAAAGHVVRTNAATFKGVERPVIVLGLDMDPGKADRRRAEVARAIYVAATRARSHLTVIGDPDVADAYEFAGLATALRRASVR